RWRVRRFRECSRALRHRADGAHAARNQGNHSRHPRTSHRGGLGAHRQGVCRERRPALLCRERRIVPRALRPNPEPCTEGGGRRSPPHGPRIPPSRPNAIPPEKSHIMRSAPTQTCRMRRRALTLALATMLAAAGTAHAFDIPVGNPDIEMRWDNTVRYNLGFRAQSQDQNLLASPNFDDGDRNFSKGSIVTNRVDVLSELDFVYKKNYGFRVSAAGWYDDAYRNLDNTNDATSNTLVNGLPKAG